MNIIVICVTVLTYVYLISSTSNKDKTKVNTNSNKINPLKENNFSVIIKHNDKYYFDKINYLICGMNSIESNKFMKFEFILNGKIIKIINLKEESADSDNCHLNGDFKLDNANKINSIEIFNYLTNEFCFKICLTNKTNSINCEYLGNKKTNDSIEIKSEKDFDIIGFYGQYTIKSNNTPSFKTIGTINKKIEKINKKILRQNSDAIDVNAFLNDTNIIETINETDQKEEPAIMGPLDLSDKQILSIKNNTASITISVSRLIYSINVEGETYFNMKIKNESHFIYDFLKYYDCTDANNLHCSLLEFYSGDDFIKNFSNCIEVSNKTLIKMLKLTDYNSISKITFQKDNTKNVIEAIQLCFKNDLNSTDDECINIFKDFSNVNNTQIPEYVFPDYEIVGFFGAWNFNQSRLIMNKFGIIMEKKQETIEPIAEHLTSSSTESIETSFHSTPSQSSESINTDSTLTQISEESTEKKKLNSDYRLNSIQFSKDNSKNDKSSTSIFKTSLTNSIFSSRIITSLKDTFNYEPSLSQTESQTTTILTTILTTTDQDLEYFEPEPRMISSNLSLNGSNLIEKIFELDTIDKDQVYSSKILIETVRGSKFDQETFDTFANVLKNFSELKSINFNTTNNILTSISDLIDKEKSNIGITKISNNFVDSLMSSVQSIMQKTDFTNHSSNCSMQNNSTCFSISTKNIGFTKFENLNTLDLSKRVIGSVSSFSDSDNKINFGYLNKLDSDNLSEKLNDDSKTAFYINTSISNDTALLVSSISFIVMKDDFFNNLNLKQTLNPNSYLSSITLKDSSNNVIKTSILLDILFKRNTINNDNQKCGYWDTTNLEWSTNGCYLNDIKSNGFYECQCDHTTFFALLGSPNNVNDGNALAYVISVSVSIFLGIIVVVLVAIKISKIDKRGLEKIPALYSTLSSFFSTLSYILASLFMIAIIYNKQSTYSVGCGFLVFLEHFFILVYFFWLLNTIMMYYFTNKFQIDNMLKYFKPLVVISFVIPFLISLILFFISLSSITIYEINNSMCWLSRNYLIGTIIAPIGLICFINLIFIILIIIGMKSSKSLNSINTLSKRRVNTFILLGCFLFSGITWLTLPITLISNNEITNGLVYFFSVLNGLQGLFIFIHFIFTTRILLKRKKQKETSSASRTLSDIEKNEKISIVKSTKITEQSISFYGSNSKGFYTQEKCKYVDSMSSNDEDDAVVSSNESRSYEKSDSDYN